MQFLDPKHPFFASKWRRWATCVLPLGWAAFEVVGGNPGWALLFGAAGAFAVYKLILTFPKDDA